MDAFMLDGNAIAGLLQELFGAEMTTAIETCNSCGLAEPLGAIHVYRGAGTVLRCPHCQRVLAKIVTDGARIWIDLRDIRMLQVPVPRGVTS
jgi:uncharacterized protein DUF6510